METRRIVSTLLCFFLLLAIGTVGYRFIEGEQWSYFDGLYMTIITLGTVGFGEIHPLSAHGRLFTIGLLSVGAGIMAYAFTSVTQFVIEGKFRELWGHRVMTERIKKLKHHYILCGAGNTGMVVASHFEKKQAPYVIIDNDPKVILELKEHRMVAYEGDATQDEVLLDVGIHEASGIVTALPNDADNVFVALTAKGLNPEIFVISTASKIESVPKLKRAGVNYVVSPNIIAGTRMASVLMRPSVVDFLDATMTGENVSLQMEEFTIHPRSFLANKALRDAEIRQRSGAIIVSVKRGDQSIINPEPTYVFAGGDILIVLGDINQIVKIKDMASG